MMMFSLSLSLNLKYLKYFKFNILTSGWFIILVYWKSGAISRDFPREQFLDPPHPLPKNCAKSDDGAEAFGLN